MGYFVTYLLIYMCRKDPQEDQTKLVDECCRTFCILVIFVNQKVGDIEVPEAANRDVEDQVILVFKYCAQVTVSERFSTNSANNSYFLWFILLCSYSDPSQYLQSV